MTHIGHYQIEAKSIPQTATTSKTEWFVDVRKPLADGKYTLVNVRVFSTEQEAIAWASMERQILRAQEIIEVA